MLQGAQQISPFPSVEDLIGRLLNLLCDQNDPERAFVKFNKGDDVVLFISNLGGLSVLELGALTQETLAQLGILTQIFIFLKHALTIDRCKLGHTAYENIHWNI